jgi:O-antigen ligase
MVAAAAEAARTGSTLDSNWFAPLMAAVAAASCAWLAVQIDLAWTFSAVIVLSVFSGQWSHLGVPIGADRLALALGLALLAWRAWRGELPAAAPRASHVRATAWLLSIAAAYAIVSATWAGTLRQHDGLYGLLDRLGIVPFLLFGVAPLVFGTERQRTILLGTLVALGGYLGVTALAEGLGLDGLVFPRYILDPTIGIHLDRARGPFVEAVADGLALFACGVAAAVAFTRWRSRRARGLALAVVALDLVGVLLTLTRAVWLAAAIVPLVVLLSSPRLVRYALPALLVGALVVGAAYATVPGLSQKAGERSRSERPIWDRVNTDEAALRMVAERPVLGFGWDRFRADSGAYMRQNADFPITGVGIPVHNVPLSHAVELGLLGLALWALAFAAAVLAPALRRGPPALEPFRLALLALALSWLVVGMFGPLGYAFPTLLLWTWAGIVHGARTTEEAV